MKHEDGRLPDAAPRRGGYALGDIVTDLWGAAPGPEQRPDAAPAPAAFPPVEQFWRAVDAAVDWTDALVRDTPPDALTTGDRWRFYHSQAPAVLAGNLQAYLTVLKTVDPLGDLKPYAHRITVGVLDADTLRCRFQVEPAYLATSPAETRRYLAAVSLRVARDLLALLPVCRVQVEACQGEQTLLEVTYPREALDNVRFGIADPVALTLDCGGRFAPAGQASSQE